MDVGEINERRLNYRLRLWAPTFASRAISAVAELLITRTWLHYVRVLAVANPSDVCNVCAPYSNFRQYFLFCTLAVL